MAMKPHPPSDPIAFFLTWTTYGSWLPGDARGWSDKHGAVRAPSPRLASLAASQLSGKVFTLTPRQQQLVVDTVRRHCSLRHWTLHAIACRPQHVHVVVAACGQDPVAISRELKGWTARALGGGVPSQSRVWTRGCSRRWVYDERGLDAVVTYVLECQDRSRE